MSKGYVLEQFEAEPGYEGATPRLASKRLFAPATSVDVSLEPSPLDRRDELRQADEPPMIFEDEHEPRWSQESRAYPDLLGFRLTHILGPPTTTVGDDEALDPDGNRVPVGAFMHVWEAPFGPAGEAPLTTALLAAYADMNTFVRLTGCAAEELELTSEEGGVKARTGGPALFAAPVDDPALTATPETLAIRPFMRRGLRVETWQGNVFDLDQFNVTITNPVTAERSLGVASGYPSIIEKGDDPITVTIEAPKRKIRRVDLEALQAATRFAVKATWVSQSTVAATSYPYCLWLEGDGAQYTGGGPEALENRRRIGANYTALLTSDGAGASARFTLVNATSSYDPTR